MSSVIRPSGPLPPRVYWVRRLLLFALVVVVVSAVWWLLSGLGNPPPNGVGAAPPTSQLSSTSTSPDPTTDTRSTEGTGVGTGRHGTPPPGTGGHPDRQHPRHPTLAAPTGPCDPGDVAIAVQVDDVVTGEAATATLSLTSLSTPACTLTVGPGTMAVRVVGKGGQVAWTSDDCPDAVPARQIVVRADPATTYRMPWDGHESVTGCTAAGRLAPPGAYWFQVALLGAEPYEGAFTVSDPQR
jgi:hypothetical protein